MPVAGPAGVNAKVGKVNDFIILIQRARSAAATGRQKLRSLVAMCGMFTLVNLHVVRLVLPASICWGEQNLNHPESAIRR